ncbi:hypothetical protein [Sphingomonas tagetis]|nr:hypothetical protein [Sphingomonas tagetis]
MPCRTDRVGFLRYQFLPGLVPAEGHGKCKAEQQRKKAQHRRKEVILPRAVGGGFALRFHQSPFMGAGIAELRAEEQDQEHQNGDHRQGKRFMERHDRPSLRPSGCHKV